MNGNRAFVDGVAGAGVFEVPILRQLKIPSVFAVLDNGEVMVQPCHVGIQGFDALDLLQFLDGTPGCAYVVVPESGYQEMEKVTVENTLLVSVSWLKAINRGSDLERVETQIRSALHRWEKEPKGAEIRRVERVCGLAGIEGVSDVFNEH
jgi:hypothetical protein